MKDITRRGAIAFGVGAAMTAVSTALAANTYEGVTGTLVVRNEVDMFGSEPCPAFQFHLTVTDEYGNHYMSQDFELKGGEERSFTLPAAYRYEVTQDEQEFYLWSCDDYEVWSKWIIPNGTREVVSHNGRVGNPLSVYVDIGSDDWPLPFRVQVWDMSGEPWRDEEYVAYGGWDHFDTAEYPNGYTYKVTYVGDRFCHLSIENGEGVVGEPGASNIVVRYTPHGHVKVRKDVDI